MSIFCLTCYCLNESLNFKQTFLSDAVDSNYCRFINEPSIRFESFEFDFILFTIFKRLHFKRLNFSILNCQIICYNKSTFWLEFSLTMESQWDIWIDSVGVFKRALMAFTKQLWFGLRRLRTDVQILKRIRRNSKEIENGLAKHRRHLLACSPNEERPMAIYTFGRAGRLRICAFHTVQWYSPCKICNADEGRWSYRPKTSLRLRL